MPFFLNVIQDLHSKRGQWSILLGKGGIFGLSGFLFSPFPIFAFLVVEG